MNLHSERIELNSFLQLVFLVIVIAMADAKTLGRVSPFGGFIFTLVIMSKQIASIIQNASYNSNEQIEARDTFQAKWSIKEKLFSLV